MGFFTRRRAARLRAAQLGQEGEDQAAEVLAHPGFFGPRGKLLRNLYLSNPSGSTTELDLVYLTRKGIFVLESKNYSGFVYGNPWEEEWTVSRSAGTTVFGQEKREKRPFYNPIWQNDRHIHDLRAYLEEAAGLDEDIPFLSVILFSDRCTLAEIDPEREDCWLCSLHRLRKTLRKALRHRPKCLSRREVRQLARLLEPLTQQSKKVQRQHVRQVKKIRRKARPGLCPRCGGRLVLRTATQGPNAGKRFYGCSNYPHCRYTEPYD